MAWRPPIRGLLVRLKRTIRIIAKRRPATELGPYARMPEAILPEILSDAGASKFRDDVDDRIVMSVHHRNGALIDSQAQIGGWPVLQSGAPYPDEDADGMEDAWEVAHGLNPKDDADGALDRDGDLLTNVEELLQFLTEEQTIIVRSSGDR